MCFSAWLWWSGDPLNINASFLMQIFKISCQDCTANLFVEINKTLQENEGWLFLVDEVVTFALKGLHKIDYEWRMQLLRSNELNQGRLKIRIS